MIVETTYTPKPPEGLTGDALAEWQAANPPRVFAIDHDFGENLLEMLRVLGAGELIDTLNERERDSISAILLSPAGFKVFFNSRARQAGALQGSVRSWMAEGLSDDELTTKEATWETPEGAPRAKDPVEKAAAMLDNLSEEDFRRVMEKRGLKVS